MSRIILLTPDKLLQAVDLESRSIAKLSPTLPAGWLVVARLYLVLRFCSHLANHHRVAM